jgi:hypothetical protein
MGAAIGEVLGLAAGVAVSPLVAMILLLATPRGRATGSCSAPAGSRAWPSSVRSSC